MVDKAWRYSFATFLFYGFLFLAYAELSSLMINFRSFEPGVSAALGILIGVIFLAAVVIWTIAKLKYLS